MDIVMKNAPHALPERFVWHRTHEGCELRLDDVAIAEVRPLNAGLVLRVLVEAGDIAPFEMAVRCEERAIGWATQWARQRAGMLCRHVDRQRTAASAAQARAAYLGLEKDGLAQHPDGLAGCIRAFRHAVEARCAAASGPPAPEQ